MRNHEKFTCASWVMKLCCFFVGFGRVVERSILRGLMSVEWWMGGYHEKISSVGGCTCKCPMGS